MISPTSTSIIVLVVTMFLAVELKASHLQPFFYWILASFVVFYIVIYGVVEFYVHLVNQGANLKKGTSRIVDYKRMKIVRDTVFT